MRIPRYRGSAVRRRSDRARGIEFRFSVSRARRTHVEIRDGF